MDDKEIAALVAALAPVIKGHVEAALAPQAARIAALEARAPVPGPKGDPGEKGSDGLTPTPEEIAHEIKLAAPEIIRAAVVEVQRLIPTPKDGEPGQKGDPGPKGDPGKDGDPGQPGKDGVGLAGAVIDRAGELVVTMTDGSQKALGPVVGKDGEPGKDGADGLGFEDMSVEMADDGRTIVHRWERGDRQKEARLQLAVVLDRGVYSPEKDYQAGDGATWGGSFWIAQRETKGEKPGEGNDGWRLAVKRGRDGKDGVMKPPPDKGPVKL